MPEGKDERKSGRRQPSVGNQLAGWQKALIWVVWLGVLALIIKNTDKDSLGGLEFLAIIAGIGITVWMRKIPKGPPNIIIEKSKNVKGVFESRTNWALVFVAAGLTLGGVAMTMKLRHDITNGISTWKDVFDDIVHYFIQELIQRLTGGLDGDVTRTKLYIMVVLLPIGLLMLWFTLVPLMHRGRRFRVEDGTLSVEKDGGWQPVQPKDYPFADADGLNINLRKTQSDQPEIVLPISRVYSRDIGTRVQTKVLVKYFREYFENQGFTVKSDSKEGMVETAWNAQLNNAEGS